MLLIIEIDKEFIKKISKKISRLSLLHGKSNHNFKTIFMTSLNSKQNMGSSDPKFSYVYGPVYSWRLGMSLGVDPVSNKEKICNFDCIYCQLGRTTNFETERKVFVDSDVIINELKTFPDLYEIDYVTFSGRGEPTLAKNLGTMIRDVKSQLKRKVAVITNAALLGDLEVQQDLMDADCVLAKLDAANQKSFDEVDIGAVGILFDQIPAAIKSFKKVYKGKLALQIMFIQNNKHLAAELAAIAKDIDLEEVELNTPLRPTAAIPLNEKEMAEVKMAFKGLPVITVYEKERKKITPFDEKETIKRHGNYKASL